MQLFRHVGGALSFRAMRFISIRSKKPYCDYARLRASETIVTGAQA